jgi:hypothetical protein
MIKLLHFVKPQSAQEYVVIFDDDEAIWEDYQNPGFDLQSEVEVVGDVSRMPTDRELWER